MRNLLRASSSALLLLVMMFVGSLVLWVGIPVGWLWIASQVQSATGSLGAALGVAALGIGASIAVAVATLGWLNRKHVEVQEARGVESYGQTALEAILALSAGIALLGFTIWFLFFAGSSPLPIANPE